MSFFAQGGIRELVVTIAAFGVLCLLTYVLMVCGENFATLIRAGALGGITRLMGLNPNADRRGD